jgi:polysaccharide pyruvyl transferase WcaK-like protein
MSENRPRRQEENHVLPGERRPLNVVLLGASFDTGNLGVNALAESTIKILLHQWPEAEITLLGNGYDPQQFSLPMGDREVRIRSVPIRFSRRLTLPYHFFWFTVYGVLAKLLPWSGARSRLFACNADCRALYQAHLVVDITGGDSFSDIYGLRRFVLGFLRKWLVLLYGKDLVMMPQTYGPFHTTVCRHMARYILKRSKRIYTRDAAGLEYLNGLLGKAGADGRVLFAPDVAFVLDARKPPVLDIDGLDHARSEASVLIGLNVSGLIYYGGYTGRNEFGLKVDYRTLTDGIVNLLLNKRNTLILLVPHVIPTGGFGANIENDLNACLDIYERLSKKYPGRLFVARGRYNHCEIKHIIGMCDFFIGTRMHACIAALSQGIPAVGLAYSKKFRGVFESVGVGDLAVEMRDIDADQGLAAVEKAFASRQATAERLRQTVPVVKQQVLTLLENVDHG